MRAPLDMEPQPKRRLNLLIVDDDDICLLMHRRIAADSGLFETIQSAKDGLGALAILEEAVRGRRRMPDIILLDLNMPFMNGVEFLETFRQLKFLNKGKITIGMLTSSTDSKDQQTAYSLGVSHFLSKPFTRKHLLVVALSEYTKRRLRWPVSPSPGPTASGSQQNADF